MFEKKYIFETKGTRFNRYYFNLFKIALIILFFYSASGYFFITYSGKLIEKANIAFYNTTPDAIIVYTGDQGRIPFAISLAKKYNQSNIFITGVYAKNSVNTLTKNLELDNLIDRNLLEIDYLARNTIENTLATVKYLNEKEYLTNILIVSHNYHLPRIEYIMKRLNTKVNNYNFYYTGVKTNFFNFNNIVILYKEILKFARTYLILLFWN